MKYLLRITTILLALLLLACNTTPAQLEDPCYRAIVHVDTLTASVDSVTWEWTPGECDS